MTGIVGVVLVVLVSVVVLTGVRQLPAAVLSRRRAATLVSVPLSGRQRGSAGRRRQIDGSGLAGLRAAAKAVAERFREPARGLFGRSVAARRREQQAFISLLDALGRALRSGSGLHQALREVASMDTTAPTLLAEVVAATDGGTPLAVALETWPALDRSPEAPLVAAVLGVGIDAGGSLTRAVDRAASTVRERAAVEREARALAAQATTSAAVVAGAPLAFAVLVVFADPAVAAFLLGTPMGWLCLTVGLTLDALGVAWMMVLIRRAS